MSGCRGLVLARPGVDLSHQALYGLVALGPSIGQRVEDAPEHGHHRPSAWPDDARLASLDAASDCLPGGRWWQSLSQRSREGREQLVSKGILIDRLVDHVGVDETEVGDACTRAVVDELYSQGPSELLDGRLAHRLRRCAAAVAERVDG